MSESEAYEHCIRIARSHYENFPVASFILPRHMRKHVAAVYAFARKADDIADEAHGDTATQRHSDTATELIAALNAMDSALTAETAVTPVTAEMIAIRHTIRNCRLDVQCFRRLLEAFRRDVMFTPMQSWDEVLKYCHYSANPVGEIMLQLFGEATPETVALSNDVCTALQVTNFIQDLSLDLANGRSYLPFSVEESIARTRALFYSGKHIVKHVKNWSLRLELRAIIAGGMTLLDLCEQTDVVLLRPRLRAKHAPRLIMHLLR